MFQDKCQDPVFQVQMHVRGHAPPLEIMPLDAMLAELRVAEIQLLFAQVLDDPMSVKGRTLVHPSASPSE